MWPIRRPATNSSRLENEANQQDKHVEPAHHALQSGGDETDEPFVPQKLQGQ